MFTRIRLIVSTAAAGIVLAVPTTTSAATVSESERFHGAEPAAKRFHRAPAGYRGWSVEPDAKPYYGMRIAGGRNGG